MMCCKQENHDYRARRVTLTKVSFISVLAYNQALTSSARETHFIQIPPDIATIEVCLNNNQCNNTAKRIFIVQIPQAVSINYVQ